MHKVMVWILFSLLKVSVCVEDAMRSQYGDKHMHILQSGPYSIVPVLGGHLRIF